MSPTAVKTKSTFRQSVRVDVDIEATPEKVWWLLTNVADARRLCPEIVFVDYPDDKPRIVDYDAKWAADSFAYNNTPRDFGIEKSDARLARKLKRMALDCWRVFGLAGYARVDFRVDAMGKPWVIDVNTNPCITPDAGFAATASVAFANSVAQPPFEGTQWSATEPEGSTRTRKMLRPRPLVGLKSAVAC